MSFDTPNVAAAKGRYVRDNQLGGVMWWEMDAVCSCSFLFPFSFSEHVSQWVILFFSSRLMKDLRPDDALGAHALVPIATNEMGGIDRSGVNCLEYSGSKWDNLRSGRV